MDWPKFTGAAGKCKKCGAQSASVRFVAARRNQDAFSKPEYADEHLERECNCCGFKWNEATLDKRGEA